MTGVLWPLLTAAPDASIINMSSTAAVMAASPRMLETARFFPPVGYWAAKAGIEALTRYTAAYGAAFGIRANAVRPGQILTPLSTRNTPGKHFADAMFAESQITPGAGTAEDVAGAVCFLASPAARFINAHVLDVDGGWVAKV
jgi:NAD(P)-dependent dehydrogenase (short-subunit alcohol dehydrogenase family)